MGPSPKRSEQMPDEWKVDDDLSLQPTAIGASLEDLELNDIESPVELVRSNGTIARDSGLPRLPMGGVDRDARDVQSPAERMMYRAASTARGLVRLLGIGLMVAVLVIAVMNWPPWVIESAHARVQVMSVLFAAGLFIVAVEDIVGINKSAMMMVLAAVMWTFLAVGYHPNNSKVGYMQLHEELNRGLEEVGSVLLFLLPAMGVVESIDHFDGFALVNMAIRRAIEGRKDRLMPIICILTFFLSSIIDNLTSTIVAVKILRRLAPENQEYRQLCGGLAVIAANAGGAWSPIGDVTTTMLWISDRISATKTVLWLFFPSLVAGVLPLWFLRCRARRLDSQTHKESQRHKAKDKKGPNWEQEPLKEDIDAEEKEPITRKKITALIFGVFCILMVPGLKMGCGLPPYLGMLLALGLMWLLTDVLQMQGAHEEEVDSEDHGPPQGGVVSAMKKVDLTGLLFFTGVLLAIGALDAAGVLKQYATMITKLCKNSAVRLSILLGLSSALVDNVPLVEASIDMFRETPTDDPLWQLVALAAGTGGSTLAIGSIAGVTLMSMEHVGFLWYFRNVGLWAAVGFFCGIGVYQIQRLIFGGAS